MKIILLKDVVKVGQKGSVKEVSDGYALNFLVPHGLAEQATSERVAALEAAQEREAEMRAEELATLSLVVKSLEGKRVEITARATEKGGLFKAVGAPDIARAIQEQMERKVPVEEVKLEKPIKQVGEHLVLLALGDARAHVTVVVKSV